MAVLEISHQSTLVLERQGAHASLLCEALATTKQQRTRNDSMHQLIQSANWLLLFLGGVFAIHWLMRGRRGTLDCLLKHRNLLISPEAPAQALVHLALPVLVYMVVGSLLRAQVPAAESIDELQPGRHLWHLIQAQDALAKLVVALVMLQILRTQQLFTEPVPKRLSFSKTARWSVLLAMGSTSVCVASLAVSTQITNWLDVSQASHPVLRGLEQSDWGVWGKVQLALGAIVVAPLFEEFFFRGLLLRAAWVLSERAWVAVLISGVLFGLIHSGMPAHIIPLSIFGAILAVVRIQTGSLSLCLLIHALFNLRPFVLIWFGGVTV